MALRRDWGKRRFPWLPSRSLSTSPRSTSMHSGGRSEGSCCSLSPARAMLPCCTPPPPPPHTSSNGPSLIWPTHGGGFEIMRGCIFVDSSNGGATRSPPKLPSASPRILPAPAPPATAPTSQTPSWSEVPDDPHTRSSPGIPLSLSEGIQGALPSIPSSFNRDPGREKTQSGRGCADGVDENLEMKIGPGVFLLGKPPNAWDAAFSSPFSVLAQTQR